MSLSHRNQSIDLQSKSIDWFLCERGIDRYRVKFYILCSKTFWLTFFAFYRSIQYFPDSHKKYETSPSHFKNICSKSTIKTLVQFSWTLFLRIWSYFLKKSLMENFIFCVVAVTGQCFKDCSIRNNAIAQVLKSSPKNPNIFLQLLQNNVL